MALIEIKNLTKDYGDGRGIFDINLEIMEGEAFGFVGTNGAGKTTLIRHLMGFIEADKGTAAIKGLDCWKQSHDVKNFVSYVPGEIAFPDYKYGTDFLKAHADLLELENMDYANYVTEQLQLDPTAILKRMSKGMKQKTALVAAFMGNRDIIILDEPTTGLDPLMRVRFLDLLRAEKKKGKTIFMSTHLFEEVEDVCDKVALIKDGKIIAVKSTKEIRHHENKQYKIEFSTKVDYQKFIKYALDFQKKDAKKNQIIVNVCDKKINEFFTKLKKYKIKFISEIKYTLEKYFDEKMSEHKEVKNDNK